MVVFMSEIDRLNVGDPLSNFVLKIGPDGDSSLVPNKNLQDRINSDLGLFPDSRTGNLVPLEQTETEYNKEDKKYV